MPGSLKPARARRQGAAGEGRARRSPGPRTHRIPRRCSPGSSGARPGRRGPSSRAYTRNSTVEPPRPLRFPGGECARAGRLLRGDVRGDFHARRDHLRDGRGPRPAGRCQRSGRWRCGLARIDSGDTRRSRIFGAAVSHVLLRSSLNSRRLALFRGRANRVTGTVQAPKRRTGSTPLGGHGRQEALAR